MRQVFQYLAFVALGCAALLSSCQRPEIPQPETLPSQLAVNFTIGFDASDTKAVKTAWENGDVVFVFFNGVTTNGSGAAKYLKLTWNSSNSSWTSTPMNGLTASDLAASPVKTLTAVYLPFSGNATVNYDSSEGFTFDPAPMSLLWHSQPVFYVLEASATDLNTTVLSLQGDNNLTMSVPEGFIQFFIDDANATEQAASDLYLFVAKVRTASPIINSSGFVTLSRGNGWMPAFVYDKQNKDSGESKGYLFSGELYSECRGKERDYGMCFRTADRNHYKLLSGFTFHSTSSSGRTFKIDPFNWSTYDFRGYLGPFKVSADKTVAFSPGNLVVTYRSNGQHEWGFESNQYDYGYGNEEPGQTYYGLSNYETEGTRATHFGWGTGDRPFFISAYSTDYSGFVDWGIHFDEVGVGSQNTDDGTWFTPSQSEWNYIWKNRPNAERLYGKGRIYVEALGKYVNGIFFFPDGKQDFVSSCGFTPAVEDNYTTNSYTTGSSSVGFNGLWSELERNGVMFLPAAGRRSGYQENPAFSFGYEGQNATYWTSTSSSQSGLKEAFEGVHYENINVCKIDFSGSVSYMGASVRLAHVWDPTYMFFWGF